LEDNVDLFVRKVHSHAQGQEEGIAWVGTQRENLAGRSVLILGERFEIKTSKFLTASEVALNAEARDKLNLPVGTAVALKFECKFEYDDE
jgi:hypothetical protein